MPQARSFTPSKARSMSSLPGALGGPSSGFNSAASSSLEGATASAASTAAAGSPNSALRVLVGKLETMEQQMQKLAVAFEATQEQRYAVIGGRLEKTEAAVAELAGALGGSQLQQRAMAAAAAALAESSGSEAPHVDKAMVAELVASATGDVAARVDVALAHLAAQGEQLSSLLQRAQAQQHSAAAVAQAAVPAEPAAAPLLPPTAAALQAVEARVQEVMEQQLQRLAVTLSDAVERRLEGVVAARMRQAEERWVAAVEAEGQQRSSAVAALREELHQVAAATPPLAEGEQWSGGLARRVEALEQALATRPPPRTDGEAAELLALQKQVEELRQRTERSLAAELLASLQQQVEELRQHTERSLALQRLPQCLQPELTPQAPTPQTPEPPLVGGASCGIEASILPSERSTCGVTLGSSPMSLEQLRARVDDLGSRSQLLERTVTEQFAEELNALRVQQKQCVAEVAVLRRHSSGEIAALRYEVQSFASELDTVQTMVVQRVGEVCTQTLNEWKEGRSEGVARLEERIVLLQEATTSNSVELQRRTSQLVNELKLEREDRCKSVADLRVQYVQVSVTASELGERLTKQGSQIASMARTLERMQSSRASAASAAALPGLSKESPLVV